MNNKSRTEKDLFRFEIISCCLNGETGGKSSPQTKDQHREGRRDLWHNVNVKRAIK
jgi:hypothetical protein